MSDLRKAAEQALEFADFMYGRWPFDTTEGQMAKRMSEALCQALAQPQQEPVAWMMEMPPPKDTERSVKMTSCEWVAKEWENPIPLYTAPPKREWVGLTDEEVETFKQSCHLGGVGYDTFIKRFAIGIEAKLKERNGG